MKNVIFTYDTIQNGERGEACATILVDDAQAWALQAAFSGKDHTKAGLFPARTRNRLLLELRAPPRPWVC